MTCHNNVLYVLLVVLVVCLVYNRLCSYEKTARTSTHQSSSQNDNKVSIVMYYAPWCGISVQFMPEWKKLVQKAKQYGVNTQMINCEENESNVKLCQDKQIEGYPTILVTKNGKKVEYEGTRDADKILSYALS
jgi:thiol-disulfide isomerase/thioredoxin